MSIASHVGSLFTSYELDFVFYPEFTSCDFKLRYIKQLGKLKGFSMNRKCKWRAIILWGGEMLNNTS